MFNPAFLSLALALTSSLPLPASASQCGLVSDKPFELMLAFGGHRSFELAQVLLKFNEPVSGKELSSRVDQPKGTFYTTLSRMEDAGLVKKEFLEDDRRVAFYRLTSKGRRWAATRAPTTYRIRVGRDYTTLGYQEARILLYVAREGQTTGLKIRDALDIHLGTLYVALSRMNDEGLVDRRNKIFSLTPQGTSAAEQISDQVKAFTATESQAH